MIRALARAALAAGALALVAFAWRCDEGWFDEHVFLPQQFFIAAGPATVFWSRAGAATLAALLLLLAIFLPRGASARRPLLAVLLAVVASEGLMQWRLRRLLNPGLAERMDTLIVPHPRYGTTLRPLLDRVHDMSGRPIRLHTDGEGRRISSAAIDPAAPSLVFTGESTVEGVGLRWEETFPAILGERFHLQVVNLAGPAYSLDQSWLRLKDALPQLDHPVAVIGLFMPGLVGRGAAAQRRPPPLLHRSGLYRLWKHLYFSDAELEQGMRSVSSAVRGIAASAQARGVPCVFLVTGHTPRWMLHDLFEAAALDYVVAEVPAQALLPDSHPGPQGNILLADALERRLRARIANW